MDNEFREFIELVFLQDKTPDYGYGNSKRDKNRFGQQPEAGKRWKTPFERSLEIARKYGFEIELWDKAK